MNTKMHVIYYWRSYIYGVHVTWLGQGLRHARKQIRVGRIDIYLAIHRMAGGGLAWLEK